MTKTQLFRFISILIAISWAGQLLALRIAGSPDRLGDSLSFVWIMFTPAACSLVYLAAHREYRRRGRWRIGGIGYLIAAPLIPALLALILIGAVAWLGWGDSAYFDLHETGVVILDGP